MTRGHEHRRIFPLYLLVVPCFAFLTVIAAEAPSHGFAADEPKANPPAPKTPAALKIEVESKAKSLDAGVTEDPAMAKEMEPATVDPKTAALDAKKEQAKQRQVEREKADRLLIESLLVSRPKKVANPPSLTSAELDSLVDKYLVSTKAPPATQTLDVEFVRRIYLDLAGKLPTPDQARAFVNSNEQGKRGQLIERLLNGLDYAQNWARYWADVIRYHATNQNIGRVGFDDLEKWLKAEIAANKPWDEVAKALITATGRIDENGAAAFTFAHEGQAVEVAGEVSRIFLGVQIQCAQCHDHPTDSWKRRQFHEFASFFAGSKVRRATKPPERPAVFEVFGQPSPRYTMPDLKDPAKMIPVSPKFFLASDASSTEDASKPLPMNLSAASRHELVASYITGQDNSWFARAYVNRIWQALVGEGFYMPVDDIGPARTAKAPEVLDALANAFRDGGYDTRWLFKTILNSKTYQREIRSTYSASGRAAFASNAPSRLRADQILDSLGQALNLPLNGQGQGQGPGAAAAKKKNGLGADLKGAVGKLKGAGARAFTPRIAFNVLFGVDPSLASDDVLGTIPQALFLMNSPLLNRSIEARNGTVLGEILAAYPDNRSALNALYVRVLAREPTAKEVQTCGKYLDGVGNRREAFEDILWSLINSTEFITRR